MKHMKPFLIITLVLLAGCMQSINTKGVADPGSIPDIEYKGYFYDSGTGERSRAVFLKDPQSTVEVVPYSLQITEAASTPDHARMFMGRKGIYDNIDYQAVFYQGKNIGYLLTPRYHSFARESVEISLHGSNGKVYFSGWKKTYD